MSDTRNGTDSATQTETQTNVRPFWKRALSFLLNIVILVALFMGIKAYQKRDLLEVAAEPAPAFALRDLDGQTHRLSDLSGKTVLLFFFAPWCSACKANVDDLNDLMGKIDLASTTILSVALGYENQEEIVGFQKKYAVRFPVLLGNRKIQQDYKVSAFPTTYVIGPDARVEDNFLGYTPGLLLKWALP